MTQDFIIYLGKEGHIQFCSYQYLYWDQFISRFNDQYFQATTQIQEQTLTFVQIVVIFICLIIFGPWMLNLLVAFTTNVISAIPSLMN